MKDSFLPSRVEGIYIYRVRRRILTSISRLCLASLHAQRGLSYELLRDLLAAGEWEKADDETRLKLIQMAGEDAEARLQEMRRAASMLPARPSASITA